MLMVASGFHRSAAVNLLVFWAMLWALGMVVVGGPAWLLVHRGGWRTWVGTTKTGLVLTTTS